MLNTRKEFQAEWSREWWAVGTVGTSVQIVDANGSILGEICRYARDKHNSRNNLAIGSNDETKEAKPGKGKPKKKKKKSSVCMTLLACAVEHN
jgi:hypothetical protein